MYELFATFCPSAIMTNGYKIMSLIQSLLIFQYKGLKIDTVHTFSLVLEE